jgi:hypothetical protein
MTDVLTTHCCQVLEDKFHDPEREYREGDIAPCGKPAPRLHGSVHMCDEHYAERLELDKEARRWAIEMAPREEEN